MRRLTTEDFIARARGVHGDKYDYTKANYLDGETKVCIIDKTHGEFWISPHNHLKGQGHPEERRQKHKKTIYGVGVNDVNDVVKGDRCYATWRGMFQRCYSKKWLKRYPSYSNCRVCEEWKLFSQFRRWYNENYEEGYDLDKDLFSGAELIYSPQTCVFLPPEINKLIHRGNFSGEFKLGVSKERGKFRAAINTDGLKLHLGLFDSENEAHEAYVKARLAHIKNVADYYYNTKQIGPRIYRALLNIQIPEY